VNDESREVFIKRTKIVREIRNFLDGRGFLEVETPVLEASAGGAAARPFITHHNSLDEDMFLRISLELPLKRLIIGGLERVYEMSKVFRNEGIDTMHNPEFTMLELYQAYTDYEGMMELSESMFREVAMKVCGTLKFEYKGQTIDLEPPFERITMTEAVKRYAGVDFDEVNTTEEARAIADRLGVKYEKRDERGNILNLIFEEYAEDKLIQPCFLTDHPIEISPLTKKKPGDPRHVERFEIFICGGEFGNAYSELNDPIDQLSRFEFQEKMRAAGDDEANMVDEDFITAMEYGMPPTGGLGVGIDRFTMLLTQSASIRDIILFPTLKRI
jgi:lysyl-tRNA synthetase class 2